MNRAHSERTTKDSDDFWTPSAYHPSPPSLHPNRDSKHKLLRMQADWSNEPLVKYLTSQEFVPLTRDVVSQAKKNRAVVLHAWMRGVTSTALASSASSSPIPSTIPEWVPLGDRIGIYYALIEPSFISSSSSDDEQHRLELIRLFLQATSNHHVPSMVREILQTGGADINPLSPAPIPDLKLVHMTMALVSAMVVRSVEAQQALRVFLPHVLSILERAQTRDIGTEIYCYRFLAQVLTEVPKGSADLHSARLMVLHVSPAIFQWCIDALLGTQVESLHHQVLGFLSNLTFGCMPVKRALLQTAPQLISAIAMLLSLPSTPLAMKEVIMLTVQSILSFSHYTAFCTAVTSSSPVSTAAADQGEYQRLQEVMVLELMPHLYTVLDEMTQQVNEASPTGPGTPSNLAMTAIKLIGLLVYENGRAQKLCMVVPPMHAEKMQTQSAATISSTVPGVLLLHVMVSSLLTSLGSSSSSSSSLAAAGDGELRICNVNHLLVCLDALTALLHKNESMQEVVQGDSALVALLFRLLLCPATPPLVLCLLSTLCGVLTQSIESVRVRLRSDECREKLMRLEAPTQHFANQLTQAAAP